MKRYKCSDISSVTITGGWPVTPYRSCIPRISVCWSHWTRCFWTVISLRMTHYHTMPSTALLPSDICKICRINVLYTCIGIFSLEWPLCFFTSCVTRGGPFWVWGQMSKGHGHGIFLESGLVTPWMQQRLNHLSYLHQIWYICYSWKEEENSIFWRF